MTCEVGLYDWSLYGPLPAPAEAAELSHCSARSAVAASTASVPPCDLTSFELTMPVDGLARIEGSCAAGVLDSIATVYASFADTLNPERRNAGLPFRLTSRLSEKTTSAEVSGVPSAKWTFLFSRNVNDLASALVQDRTSSGIGWARSFFLYVNSVS